MWIILPGLACPPQDYAELQRELGAWVMDAWVVGLDATIDELREYAFREIAEQFGQDAAKEPVRILGHSMGGLLAIEWAAMYPEEVAEIILADPTTPRDARVTRWDAGERVWGFLGTECGARVPGALLAPVLPFMRWLMTHTETKGKDALTKEERKRYFHSVHAGQTLIRQNCACEMVQRRAFNLLGREEGAAKGWLGETPVTLLVADEPANASDIDLQEPSAFVREQMQLARRLGVEPHFHPSVGHLFPIYKPQLVLQYVQNR